MQVTRELILELDKKRTKIEKEIMEITNYLNSDGMPGVEGRLTDEEGFPLPNLDLTAVRTARNKLISKYKYHLILIVLQNDLKNLMNDIESQMQIYFKNQNENKTKIETKDSEFDKNEPIPMQIFEDDKITAPKLTTPFATVSMVAEGSPAEECGLKVGDKIIRFDNILYFGVSPNPLQKVAEIVGKKINSEIPIEIMRHGTGDSIEFLTINLVPHQWSGQGVLGCKLNLA
jgi:26S proteasome non-ATPase regulatory subunit 9